jgi:transposase-like protein
MVTKESKDSQGIFYWIKLANVSCTFDKTSSKKVPKKKQKEMADKIKEAMIDRQKYNDLIKELDSMGYWGTADKLERFQYDVMNYMQFPEKHWKKIRTTNMMDRANKEVKRKTRVVGAFPDKQLVLRLAVSILIDMNEDWITGNKYIVIDINQKGRQRDEEQILQKLRHTPHIL